MLIRKCTAINEKGEPCRQAPLVSKDYCYWHDPDNEAEAAEVRRLGGQNRKRELTLRSIYDLGSLTTVEDIRRVLDLAILGAMSQENTLNRARVLIAGALAAAKLLEVGELESRLESIEATLGPRIVNTSKRR